MTIDWTKPIRRKDDKSPAHLVATLKGPLKGRPGERSRTHVVIIQVYGEERVTTMFDSGSFMDVADAYDLENVPEETTQWLNFYPVGGKYERYCRAFASETMADLYRFADHTKLKVTLVNGEVTRVDVVK